MRGFLKKFLIFMTVMLIMQIGGDVFDPRPTGHLLYFIVGVCLGIGAVRAGYGFERK